MEFTLSRPRKIAQVCARIVRASFTRDAFAKPLLRALDEEPDRFFVPPYVGHRGWLGVRLDRKPDWAEVAGICEDAYRAVAPKTLVARFDAD